MLNSARFCRPKLGKNQLTQIKKVLLVLQELTKHLLSNAWQKTADTNINKVKSSTTLIDFRGEVSPNVHRHVQTPHRRARRRTPSTARARAHFHVRRASTVTKTPYKHTMHNDFCFGLFLFNLASRVLSSVAASSDAGTLSIVGGSSRPPAAPVSAPPSPLASQPSSCAGAVSSA